MAVGSKSNINLVRAKFLSELVLIQQDTAPIDLTIGTTINGSVHSEYIKIMGAAPLVVKEVVELSEKYGLLPSLHLGGLLIDFTAAKAMTQADFFK